MRKADGIVLETCIGNGLNYPYYRMQTVKKIIGLDWVQRSNHIAERKAQDINKVTVVNCDVHKMPFKEGSFDTVIDTFGLECTYDIERAYSQMK